MGHIRLGFLREHGWVVVRIWEHQLSGGRKKAQKNAKVVEKIRTALEPLDAPPPRRGGG